jgi:hypothetical protein
MRLLEKALGCRRCQDGLVCECPEKIRRELEEGVYGMPDGEGKKRLG